MAPCATSGEHLIGGFRGAGLHPLSRDAIPASKLKVFIPFQTPLQPQSTQSQESQSPPQSEMNLQQQPPTPVTIHIAQFFGNLFISQGAVTVSTGAKGRTKPSHYGEALTEEEVIERIRKQEEEKKERAAKKGSTRKNARGRAQERGRQTRGRQTRGRQTGGKCGEDEDENICQVCRGNYDDDGDEAQEGWIGFDEMGCWR